MHPKIAAVGLLVTVALPGCVSQGKYEAAVADRDALRSSIEEEQRKEFSLESALRAAEAKRAELGRKLALAISGTAECQKALDDFTAQNAELGKELTRLGKDVDQLLSEKGALAGTLATSKKRLEELRRAQEAAEARAALFRELALKLKQMVDAGELSIVLRDGRMVLRLPDDVLFDSGKIELKASGQAALDQIAGVLKLLPERRFQVAGHTDNEPIRMSGYASNWQLSTARALQVVAFLVRRGMDPQRLSAAGYGEFDPIAGNDTAEGRSKNRRIEITLQPRIEELVTVP